jgi:hypothetical protein
MQHYAGTSFTRSVRSPTRDSLLWLVLLSRVLEIRLSHCSGQVTWQSVYYNPIIGKAKRINLLDGWKVKLTPSSSETSRLPENRRNKSTANSEGCGVMRRQQNYSSSSATPHKHTFTTNTPLSCTDWPIGREKSRDQNSGLWLEELSPRRSPSSNIVSWGGM